MDFELAGPIREVQPIAVGRAIRGLVRLRKRYGSGRWRKLKGIARVRLIDGTIHPGFRSRNSVRYANNNSACDSAMYPRQF